MSLCTCPRPAAIVSLSAFTCPETLGQLQKVIFQRKKNGTALNFIDLSGDADAAKKLATYTDLTGASDSTKATISPVIHAPENEPGAAREVGGGNDTPGGVPIIRGRDASSFTGLFRQVPQVVIEELKDYECEVLAVYLIDEYGRIAGTVDDLTTPTKFYPIPIYSFFVSDKKLGGFDDVDSNSVRWFFYPNWSKNFKMFTPSDFNALEDL